MPPPDFFEQITWDEWINSYWIQTISLYESPLYLRVRQVTGLSSKHHRIPESKRDAMETGFVQGEDGFVYAQYRDRLTSEIYHEPIYTLRTGA